MRDDDERKGEGETRCRIIACSSRKAPRGPPGLTPPSDGRTAMNRTICLLNIYTVEGFGILSRPVMYNLAIRKCTSPPPPSPEVENFQMKIYYPAGDRTPDLMNQRQTCYHLSQHGEHLQTCNVCMCECFFMPSHCNITCFGFYAMRIDGFSVGLFSIHAPLGQTKIRGACVSAFVY